MPQRLSAAGPRAPSARAGRRGRAGFTIVELLVAATLLVLIVATLGTMLVDQFRIFGRTQGAVQVQRDLRTGLGLLPLDLRAAARAPGVWGTEGDLRQLTDSSIELRATIGASIVCARGGATLDLPALDLTRNRLTAWYAQPHPGDTLLVYVDSTSVGPEDDRWQPLVITAFAPASGTCGGPPYVDPAVDPGAGSRAWRVTLGGTIPSSVAPGAPVRFLRSVRYSLYRPGATSQWYLGYREYRAGVWEVAAPIAGPYEAAGGARAGLRFSYFDTLGAALATPPNPLRVGRIDVLLRSRALVRGGRDSTVVRDSLALRIALRNRL